MIRNYCALGVFMTRIVTSALRSSAGMIAAAAVVLSACSTSHPPTAPQGAWGDPGRTVATTAQVLDAVKAAQNINDLPNSVGFLTKADWWPMATGRFDCHQVHPHEANLPANIVDPSRASEFGQCAAGAEHGTKLMVAFGDSGAGMWGAALEGVAANNGYQLRTFHMANCPPLDLHFFSYEKHMPDDQCYQFRQSAIAAIRNLHPDLVIVASSSIHRLADLSWPTAARWQEGLESTFRELTQPGTRLAMFGDIPEWDKDNAHCLAGHVMGVQKCSVPISEGTPSGNLGAEQAAASAAGALYIPTMPWVCANRCEPVIADIRVYQDRFHFTNSYAKYLTGAVGEALQPALSTLIDTRYASAGPCADVEVVFARGTYEPPGVGSVGQAFVDSLRSKVSGRSVAVYAVNYPATDDYGSSPFAGAGDARAHVQSMVANCPNTRMVLGGYSQGAGVIDMTTEQLPPEVADQVAAVAVFGNPESAFARTLGGGPLPTISPLYRPKTIDLCVPDDPICSEGRNATAHVLYVQSGMTNQAAAFAASRL